MQKHTSNKGVTLVALVVTMVVIMILASVSINLLAGEDGLISFVMLREAEYQNTIKTEEEKTENLKGQVGDINNAPPYGIIEITENTSPYYPDENFKVIEGTIDTGLVIENLINGNQYVWVEVPKKTTGMADIAVVDSYNMTDEEVEEIVTVLRDYSYFLTYAATSQGDVWHEGIGISEEEYNKLYKKIIQNIYNYGGFWIARFEAGTADGSVKTTNAAITDSSPNAVYKYDQIPYGRITVSEAQTLASRDSTSKYSSTLMLGLNWNLTCKFIETNGYLNDGSKITTADINTNSVNWGNYYSSIFTINRKTAKIATDEYASVYNIPTEMTVTPNTTNQLTSGASEQNKVLNIYDLAGSMGEWTMEYYGSNGYPLTFRGGDFEYTAAQTAFGYSYSYPNTRSYYLSFRPILVKEETRTIDNAITVTQETIPYYPDNNFTVAEGTLDTGMVIENATTGSQYVWVEVPKVTSGISAIPVADIDNMTQDEITAVATVLKTYSVVSMYNETEYIDEWYDGCGLTQTEYNDLYKKMIQGIYKYGGF